MKTMNKTLALLLAMIMIFTLSIGAFATDPATSSIDNVSPDATFTVGGTPYETTVSVSLQGVTTGYQTYSITLPEKTIGLQFVSDVILEMNQDTSIPVAFGVMNNGTFSQATAATPYFNCIRCGTDGNYTYESAAGFSGWMFRVNDLIPLLPANTDPTSTEYGRVIGASIAQTPICDGDRISFYYDDTARGGVNAKFTRISSIERGNDELLVTVQESHQNFETTSPYAWTVSRFVKYTGITVKLYDEAGVERYSAETNEDGLAVLNTEDLSSGTYTIKVTGLVEGSNIVSTVCEETVNI